MNPQVGLLAPLTLALLVGPCLAAQAEQESWQLNEPAAVQLIARTSDRSLAEASGLAKSRANPGLFWTIQDSGNPPALLAIDTTGRLRASITLTGAANVDWEAVTTGECGDSWCVYITDTGDNRERRDEVTIYRLAEPMVASLGEHPRISAERLRVRYPDGSHDVEAAGVLPGGDLLLASKGRSGLVVLFTLPASAWTVPAPAVATILDTLPITPQIGQGRAITDLALSLDGDRLALRTYREIFLFDRDTTTGKLTPHRWSACNLLGREPQGEGIAWGQGEWEFTLLSERGLFKRGTLMRVDCGPIQTSEKY